MNNGDGGLRIDAETGRIERFINDHNQILVGHKLFTTWSLSQADVNSIITDFLCKSVAQNKECFSNTIKELDTFIKQQRFELSVNVNYTAYHYILQCITMEKDKKIREETLREVRDIMIGIANDVERRILSNNIHALQ